MIQLLFLYLSAMAVEPIHYNDLGIYSKIISDQVAVSPKGELYVVNIRESTVTHFDPNGKPLGAFCSTGKGPGEVSDPFEIQLVGDVLYIFEIFSASRFRLDGTFLDKATPGRWEMAGTKNGVFGFPLVSYKSELKASLSFVDMTVASEPREIVSFVREKNSAYIQAILKNNEIFRNFNPARDHPMVLSSHDGEYLWFRKPKEDNIHIFNSNGSPHTVIKLPVKGPIRYVETWADEVLAKEKEKINPRKRKVTYKKYYSDHFPFVMNLRQGPDKLIYVELWTASPGKHREQLAFSLDGKQQEPGYTPEEMDRVVAFAGEWAVISVWDEVEEHARLIRCKVPDLKPLIANYPNREKENLYWE